MYIWLRVIRPLNNHNITIQIWINCENDWKPTKR